MYVCNKVYKIKYIKYIKYIYIHKIMYKIIMLEIRKSINYRLFFSINYISLTKEKNENNIIYNI